MKKLMIAAAIVCAAVMAEASSFKWKTAVDDGVSFPGGTSWPSANAYIFAASTSGEGATVLQKTLVDAFAAGTLDLTTAGALDFSLADMGDIAKNDDAFTYGIEGDSTQYYFALIAKDGAGKDMLYISNEVKGAGQSGAKVVTISFEEAAASKLAAKDATGSYQGAGWYTAATPVPEPTSGLLLLLGVAGLALRRRRA